MASKLRTARLRAGISQHDVAVSVGRTAMWLSNAERNKVPVSPELGSRILTAIARLAELKETIRVGKETLIADLKVSRSAGSSIG